MNDPAECAACGRSIDADAKICPFCGADAHTGEKIDTAAILREHFSTRKAPPRERFVDFFRHRQTVVMALVVLGIIGSLIVVHQIISRQQQDVRDIPAIPLSQLVETHEATPKTQPPPLPDVEFQYHGDEKDARTLITEPGAVAPAPPPQVTSTATTSTTREGNTTVSQPARPQP
ncbi:MAG: hypothetical protein WBX15_09765 [Thermoanaerobaculia bacterium]